MDLALIERTLKDADKLIEWITAGAPVSSHQIDGIHAEITAALMDLRKVPTPALTRPDANALKEALNRSDDNRTTDDWNLIDRAARLVLAAEAADSDVDAALQAYYGSGDMLHLVDEMKNALTAANLWHASQEERLAKEPEGEMLYRRKQGNPVKATQWFPGIEHEGVRYLRSDVNRSKPYIVTIHDQPAYLTPSDWILPELKLDRFYPVKDEVFRSTYEPVHSALCAARGRASEPAAQSYADWQQKRGRNLNIVDEAIAAYDEWMLDDDFDGINKLQQIIERMRERRGASEPEPTRAEVAALIHSASMKGTGPSGLDYEYADRILTLFRRQP